MSFRPFTSESYAEDDRPEAWRDVLSAVGLQPAAGRRFLRRPCDRVASQCHRRGADPDFGGIAGRIAVAAIRRRPADRAAADRGRRGAAPGTSHRIIPAGHLLLLPRSGDWSVVFQRDMRAIVLSVTSEALHGRITGKSRFGEARVVAPGGLTEVFSRMLDATARTLETLADVEWAAVAQGLADLLLTFAHQLAGPASDAGHTATQAAILHRLCQTIERQLDDPDLTPARVAQAEGISERYLQKLFEGVGDNFTHYVRERRLQRAWADLSNPAEAHHSISEIAYRYGFGDSAHFSRAFRHRFGLPPREFRQQEVERAAPPSARPANAAGGRRRARAFARASAIERRREKPSRTRRRRIAYREREGRSDPPPSFGGSGAGALGLFQPHAAAANRDQFRRHHHDRDPDAACLRRSRADDRRRRRRRKRVRLDQPPEECRSARRRADGCIGVRPRRRRGVRRAHLHRPGRGEGRAARRRARGPHPRHRAAAEPQPAISKAGCSAPASRRGGDITTTSFSPSRNRAKR